MQHLIEIRIKKNRVERPHSDEELEEYENIKNSVERLFEEIEEYEKSKKLKIFYEQVIASMSNMYDDDTGIPELVDSDSDSENENENSNYRKS
jgi:hypothetical protein